MAAQIAEAWFAREDLDVTVKSAGVSSEETGNPTDRRAAKELRDHGYSVGNHRASKATAELIDESDLIVVFEPIHAQRLAQIAPHDNVKLITDFDLDARGTVVDDPWYGTQADFGITRRAIEAAMPGLVAYVRDQL